MDKTQAPVAQKAQPQATDEMQKKAGEVAKRFVTAAMKLLYSSKEAAAAIVDMVAQTPSPEDGLAHAAMAILGRIREQAKGIDPNLVFAIAPVVIAMIAELAVAAKAMPADQKIMSAALEKMKPLIAQAAQGGQKQAPQQPQQQPAAPAEHPAPQGIVAEAMGA